MRGNLIETEAHKIYESGREEGREEGVVITKAILKLDSEGYEISDIAVELSVSEDMVRKVLD